MKLLADHQVGSWSGLFLESNPLNFANKFQSASIQDGNFQIVELNNSVVDAKDVKGRKEMLDCRNQNALLHQGCCVGDVRDILDRGFNRKVLEVNSVENDAVARRGWQDSEVDRSARVKADSGKRDWLCQSVFVFQKVSPNAKP